MRLSANNAPKPANFKKAKKGTPVVDDIKITDPVAINITATWKLYAVERKLPEDLKSWSLLKVCTYWNQYTSQLYEWSTPMKVAYSMVDDPFFKWYVKNDKLYKKCYDALHKFFKRYVLGWLHNAKWSYIDIANIHGENVDLLTNSAAIVYVQRMRLEKSLQLEQSVQLPMDIVNEQMKLMIEVEKHYMQVTDKLWVNIRPDEREKVSNDEIFESMKQFVKDWLTAEEVEAAVSLDELISSEKVKAFAESRGIFVEPPKIVKDG